MSKRNEIIEGDCLEVMQDIPDGSIDMILCDLPYGTTACAWDAVIPFGPLWKQYKRVIKERGAVVLTGSQPFTTDLIMSNRKWFKYAWVWDKKKVTRFLDAKIRPLNHIEDVVIFSSGNPNYNPQMTSGKSHTRGRQQHEKNTEAYSKYKNVISYGNTEYYPKQLLNFSAVVNGHLHPTQKPVALFSYLIRTYTNPGALVLDNCAGSGTTAIAAIETGRDWLLIEQDPEYYQMAKERIAEKLKQPFLFDVNPVPKQIETQHSF